MPRFDALLASSLACSLALAACGQGDPLAAPAHAAPPPAATPAKAVTAQPAPAKAAQPAAATPVTEAELVARGAQLVGLGGCHDCHTPMKFDRALGMPVPQRERALSGHPEGAPDPQGQPGAGDQGVIGATFTSFRLPFGVVYAANLTPDATGLGGWTREQFINTVRSGHRQGNGRPLLPPMPWQNLAAASDADLNAIFAYLRSVPAIKNRVPAPQVPAPVLESISKNNQTVAKMVQR
jgi:hypothetical protein